MCRAKGVSLYRERRGVGDKLDEGYRLILFEEAPLLGHLFRDGSHRCCLRLADQLVGQVKRPGNNSNPHSPPPVLTRPVHPAVSSLKACPTPFLTVLAHPGSPVFEDRHLNP